MEMLARVRIVMWEGASLWITEVTPATGDEPRRTDYHAHHAIQVTLGLGGRFRLATANSSMESDVVAVAADAPHVFEPEGLTAFVFIEPESRAGRVIARHVLGDADLVAIPAAMVGELRERIACNYHSGVRDDAALIALGRELVAVLAAGAPVQELDPRVRKVIAWASGEIDEPISLSDAVAVGGLSAGRLRHLFVEQTGLPFKTYVLWLRLTRAVDAIASGSSLTKAAHQAGFSDSAHLSRTFRRMFGIPPASLRIS